MSLGIGVYPVDGMDAQTLFKSADVALSEAKAHGRNRHQFFEPRRGSRNHAPAEELIRVRQEEEQEAAARPC